MALDFSKYKRYDTSQGYGNARQWRGAFRERLTGEQIEEVLTKAKRTPHDILGVAPSATEKEIKKAFNKLAKEWHPDVSPHADAHERFLEIRAAYEKLVP